MRQPLHKLRRVHSPWIVLAVLGTAQFIDILDVTIVNVALPHISRDLHFGAASVQWVITAYTLLYGGFLLLGGRLADLFGRRRLFLTGLALFGSASLAAGLAPDAAALVGIRAVQGLGGAMIAPAALSLLTVTFPSGRDRNVALGIWGSLAGLGGTFGVVIGGLLIDSLSWRAIFLVNVPIVIALLVLAPFVLEESRADRDSDHHRPDVLGAMLGTGGLLALVLAVVRAEPLGFGSLEVLALAAISVLLLSAFVVVERRSKAPLLPLSLFRNREPDREQRDVGRQRRRLSRHVLPHAASTSRADCTNRRSTPASTSCRWGSPRSSRPSSSLGSSPAWAPARFSLAVPRWPPPASSFWPAAAPRALTPSSCCPGCSCSAPASSASASPPRWRRSVRSRRDEAGVASGVVNTAWQVGGSLGLAIASTISASHVAHRIHAGANRASALVSGYHYGLAIAAGLAVLTAMLVFLAPRLRPTAEQVAAATA